MTEIKCPKPAEWPPAYEVHCEQCNEPCVVNVIEIGEPICKYVCAQHHDTPIMAKYEDDEWAFSKLPH